jgi:hypothetical protein
MRQDGFLRIHRGIIGLLKPEALEDAACDCSDKVNRHHEMLFADAPKRVRQGTSCTWLDVLERAFRDLIKEPCRKPCAGSRLHPRPGDSHSTALKYHVGSVLHETVAQAQ